MKKSFNTQHGRIPINPAILAAIGYRLTKKRKLKMQTCGSEVILRRPETGDIFVWPYFAVSRSSQVKALVMILPSQTVVSILTIGLSISVFVRKCLLVDENVYSRGIKYGLFLRGKNLFLIFQ